jgi:hypothetical protein
MEPHGDVRLRKVKGPSATGPGPGPRGETLLSHLLALLRDWRALLASSHRPVRIIYRLVTAGPAPKLGCNGGLVETAASGY